MTFYHEQYTTNLSIQYILYDDTGVSGFVYVVGQTFTPLISHTISAVEFKLLRTGSGCGNITCYLKAVDGSHLPTGSVLATSSAVDSSTITTDAAGEFITFTFASEYTVSANTEYAIYLIADSGDASNLCQARANVASPTYELGARLYSTDGGSSWSWLVGADVAFRCIQSQTAAGTSLNDFYQGSATAYLALNLDNSNDWAGQTFTPTTSYTLTHLAIWCAKGIGDNVGTIDVELYAVDGSGHPTGTALASGTIADADIGDTTAYSWVLCELSSGYALIADIQYAIVVHGDSLDASNILTWAHDDLSGSSDYAGGAREWSANGGSSWATTTTSDLLFRAYGSVAASDKWRIVLTEYMPAITPYFADVKLANRTASRLLGTDGSKITSSEDLVNWVAGTTNRITVTDDTDGTITLSGPQDIHTGASPTFADLTLSAPSNIYALSHDSFADFVADEHVAHSGVTLTAGTGLTGGGDISANRTFAVDGVLEDLDTLGANGADSEFLVGTGAGVLAWESGATARTSLGVDAAGTAAGLVATHESTYNHSNYNTAYTHSQLTSGNPHQVTKSDVGLGSVENTALSTWAGTTNITTLGTIATGIWNGTTIAIANGGTGQTTAQAAINALTVVSGATNEHVLTKDTATGNAIFKAAAGGGGVAGADTQIQYNNGGAFGGCAGLVYNDANGRVGIGIAAASTLALLHLSHTLNGAGGDTTGCFFDLTGSAAGANPEYGLGCNLEPGYTGSTQSIALIFNNYSSGTGADALGAAAPGNFGFFGTCYAVTPTVGDCVGGGGWAAGGNRNYGGMFYARGTKASAVNVGVVGQGLNAGASSIQCGGYFATQTGTPTFVSAALIADNGTATNPIFLGRDNGTIVFGIYDGGWIQIRSTADAYPLLQMLNYSHDNMQLLFDSYYDGSYRSSDAGSNFGIRKYSDKLYFDYDSGIAAGNVLSFDTAMSIDITGGIFMPNLKSGATQAAAGAAANELYHDTDDNTIKIGV